MKQEIINRVTKNLNFKGTTEQTKSSTRFKSFIDTEEGVADFTVIFPLTEDDSKDFKVQFNGRGSQSLNKSLGLKVQVVEAVNTAINPVNTEVAIELRNSEIQKLSTIYGNNPSNTTQFQPVSNTITKKHLTPQQRKNKRKMAKKSRKLNRRR